MHISNASLVNLWNVNIKMNSRTKFWQFDNAWLFSATSIPRKRKFSSFLLKFVRITQLDSARPEFILAWYCPIAQLASFDVNISQGSVAKRLWVVQVVGSSMITIYTANLLLSVLVKSYTKSVNIYEIMTKTWWLTFGTTQYIAVFICFYLSIFYLCFIHL